MSTNLNFEVAIQSDAFLKSLMRDTAGFNKLAQILHQEAGIFLPESAKNTTLMATRLIRVMKPLNVSNYTQYLSYLKGSDAKHQIQIFIQALTTNTTQFYREEKHIEVFRKLLPLAKSRLDKNQQSDLRVWCSAASTGQEPYTIAIEILEALPPHYHEKLKFLATDIDLEVLKYAAKAVYTESECQSLPNVFKLKYFERIKQLNGSTLYHANPELGNAIRFARLNLLDSHYPFKHAFDFVWCRNVLIYFDAHTANKVISKMVAQLRVGGYLFLGHSEAGLAKSANIKQVAHSVYERIS